MRSNCFVGLLLDSRFVSSRMGSACGVVTVGPYEALSSEQQVENVAMGSSH